MIPKKIHYFWIGGGKKSDLVKNCIESWRKFCPGYEIVEWNEANYDFNKHPYMKQAYSEKKWGFVTDYARLDVVYRYGGIYLDTDVELVRSLDDLLSLKGFFGFEDIGTGDKRYKLNTGVGFGAEAETGLVKELRDFYDNISFIKEDGRADLTPCTEYIAEVFKKYGISLDNRNQRLSDGIRVYSSEYFSPKSYTDGTINLTKNTYSIHHFAASWHSRSDRIATSILRRSLSIGKHGKVVGLVISLPFRAMARIEKDGMKKTILYTASKFFGNPGFFGK